jgi:hypothetical protein
VSFVNYLLKRWQSRFQAVVIKEKSRNKPLRDPRSINFDTDYLLSVMKPDLVTGFLEGFSPFAATV